METFSVRTKNRFDMVDITSEVRSAIRALGVQNGIALVFVPHTTAAVTINENADPSVVSDIKKTLNTIVPQNANYSHMEGNSQAHLLSSLVGAEEMIIVSNGKPVLGTWQGIYFCDYDGPRNRTVHVQSVGGAQ